MYVRVKSIYSDLPNNLRYWKHRSGLSNADLAELACCSESSIPQWERGEKEPKLYLARRVVEVLSDHLERPLNTYDVWPAETAAQHRRQKLRLSYQHSFRPSDDCGSLGCSPHLEVR